MPAHELWSKNGKVAKVLLKQYINTTDLVGWLRSCWIWHVCRSLSKQSNSINRNIFLFSIGFPLAHCKVETNGLSLNQYDSLITVTLSCRIGTSKKKLEKRNRHLLRHSHTFDMQTRHLYSLVYMALHQITPWVSAGFRPVWVCRDGSILLSTTWIEPGEAWSSWVDDWTTSRENCSLNLGIMGIARY